MFFILIAHCLHLQALASIYNFIENQQARKLQATLEGCNPKLSLTYLLTDGGKV